MSPYRVGHGYDIHPLRKGRPLVLGGVPVKHTHGLSGHSDADCLLHALADAVLGAAGLGDLGEHFPPGDARYKDKASAYFLKRAVAMAKKKGWRVANADATVYAEVPRLARHKTRMQKRIAACSGIPAARVNVKAKTMERMGPVGRKKAIAAEAVVLLEKRR